MLIHHRISTVIIFSSFFSNSNMISPNPLLYSCSNQNKFNLDLPMMFLTMLSLFFLHKYMTDLCWETETKTTKGVEKLVLVANTDCEFLP